MSESRSLKPGLYWVRTTHDMTADAPSPAELADDGQVWVLGFDKPLDMEEIREWGDELMSADGVRALRVRAEAAEAAIALAIDASDNDGGSANDAIQDMLGILRGDEVEDAAAG